MGKIVLVGVLKDARDLRMLLTEHWYRIPVAHAPARHYTYLAFYQPAVFGKQGKCIRYYARVLDCKTVRRDKLLPDEANHPWAREEYLKIHVGKIQKLLRPIRNIIPRRVNFGFTTLHHLQTARDMLQLYDVVPIEQMVGDALERSGITALPEYTVTGNGTRYRLDFAILYARGKIAIECDNTASHTSQKARQKDKQKDQFLRRLGWTVIRLPERAIIANLDGCVTMIQGVIRNNKNFL
ncbi:MAG: DUF559 domain-containing protein [bacterium]|nr:DUF559 domain-containing protein [bacterium]